MTQKILIGLGLLLLLVPNTYAFFDTPSNNILVAGYNSNYVLSNSTYWNLTGNDISNLNTGNVGIGITEPNTKLDIVSSTDKDGINIQAGNGAVNTSASIKFKTTTIIGNNYYKSGIFAVDNGLNNARNNLYFAIDNGADPTNVDYTDAKMVILSDGKVGIGTITPTNILHIKGTNGLIKSDRAGIYN